jgi:adenylate cyclase
VVAVTIQFVLQMNRLIGTNVLGYFVAGVYHRPKTEERIFLFLDLEGSTQLAERLGSTRYFELLRRFVDDLTEPVLEAEGEIHQYAGGRGRDHLASRCRCPRGQLRPLLFRNS